MTEPDLLESAAAEPPPSSARDHPPFRMRERRLVLLPDLRPPSLDELRWSVRERRRRRDGVAPQQRVPDAHEQFEAREPADVPATTIEEPQITLDETVIEIPDLEVAPEPELEPVTESGPEPDAEVVAESLELDGDADFFDLHDPEFPELRPWRPVVMPEAEPEIAAAADWVSDLPSDSAPVVVEPLTEPVVEPEAPVDDVVEPDSGAVDENDEPPLVSQVLVVREPAPSEPGRIAVLDEVEAEAPTVTRLVPLPVESVGDTAGDLAAYEAEFDYADLESVIEDDAAVEPADRTAPLYWRLLRLRHTRPNGWLRALYFEGSVLFAVVLVLAEAASVWTIVVLPLVVAVVVKANDVLAGNLRRTYRQPKRRSGS